MNVKANGVPKLEAKVRPYQDTTGRGTQLLGFAELVIGGAFVIKNIRILMGKSDGSEDGRPFVAFPSRKGNGSSEGKYFDIAHPITHEARQTAIQMILRAYDQASEARLAH
ncbi:MAG: septation protein SpoVG family protein [Elusimicrobia bacterium]|nr:septation protein SpoVG family protein [Elusimicrobiota bacterium]